MLTPKLLSAEFVESYIIRLTFSDGLSAAVDFAPELVGEAFEPLLDHHYFRSFKYYPQFGTIGWGNGADFAPEFIYSKALSAKH